MHGSLINEAATCEFAVCDFFLDHRYLFLPYFIFYVLNGESYTTVL